MPDDSLAHGKSPIHLSTSHTIHQDNAMATRYFQFLSSHKEDVIAQGIIQNLTSLLYEKHKCNTRSPVITPQSFVLPTRFQHRESLECFLNDFHDGHLKNDFQTILASNDVMSYVSIRAPVLFNIDIEQGKPSQYKDSFLSYQGEIFQTIL